MIHISTSEIQIMVSDQIHHLLLDVIIKVTEHAELSIRYPNKKDILQISNNTLDVWISIFLPTTTIERINTLAFLSMSNAKSLP